MSCCCCLPCNHSSSKWTWVVKEIWTCVLSLRSTHRREFYHILNPLLFFRTNNHYLNLALYDWYKRAQGESCYKGKCVCIHGPRADGSGCTLCRTPCGPLAECDEQGTAMVLILYGYSEHCAHVWNKSGIISSVQEVVTPFYIVSYYIKRATTSWTYSTKTAVNLKKCL